MSSIIPYSTSVKEARQLVDRYSSMNRYADNKFWVRFGVKNNIEYDQLVILTHDIRQAETDGTIDPHPAVKLRNAVRELAELVAQGKSIGQDVIDEVKEKITNAKNRTASNNF